MADLFLRAITTSIAPSKRNAVSRTHRASNVNETQQVTCGPLLSQSMLKSADFLIDQMSVNQLRFI